MDHVRQRKPSEWISLAGGLLFIQSAVALFVVPYSFLAALKESGDALQAVSVAVGLTVFVGTPFVLGVAVQGHRPWAWRPAVIYASMTMVVAFVGAGMVDRSLGYLFVWTFAALVILMMGPVRQRFQPGAGPLERADQRSAFRARRALAAESEPSLGSVVKNWRRHEARDDGE